MLNLAKEVTLSRFFLSLTLKNFLALTIWMILLAAFHFKFFYVLLRCIFHYMFPTYYDNFLLTFFYLCYFYFSIYLFRQSEVYSYTVMVLCSRFIWIINSSDYRRV